MPRKLSKRGVRKVHKRNASKSRLPQGHSSTSLEEHQCSDSGGSFLALLAAGLASVTAAFLPTRSARRIYVASLDEDEETEESSHFSVRGSVKSVGTHLTGDATVSTAELSVQRRHLAALNSHLMGTLSTAPSLCDISDDAGDNTPAPVSAKLLELEEQTAQPRKRRSFFGSILASFARASSSMNMSSSGDNSVQAALHSQHASKRGGQLFFSGALSDK